MDESDRYRCERLARASKKGQHISPEDFAFMERMWREHPAEYKAIGEEVREQVTAELNPLYRRGSSHD